MPPLRGGRTPGTNETRGPSNFLYQPLRQSGRARRPSSKFEDNAYLQHILDDIDATTQRAAAEPGTSVDVEPRQAHYRPEQEDVCPPQTTRTQDDIDTIMTSSLDTPSPSRPEIPNSISCIPQTPCKRPTHNLRPIIQLTSTTKEAFSKDDTRRNKMKHHFLKIAAALDAELARAQEAGYEEAQALTRDIREILEQHCSRHSIGYKPQNKAGRPALQHPSRSEVARMDHTEQSSTTPPYRKNPYRHPPTTANMTQPNKNRIFIRITIQHSARKLSPFAILQKLRTHLLEEASINEIQAVPTGFVLLPKDVAAAQQILQSQNIIHALIKDATIEMEEKWTIAIIPELPTTTQSFEEEDMLITEDMAKTELELMTGVQLERTRWSKATVEKKLQRGTLVIACKSENVAKLPNRIALFGA